MIAAGRGSQMIETTPNYGNFLFIVANCVVGLEGSRLEGGTKKVVGKIS